MQTLNIQSQRDWAKSTAYAVGRLVERLPVELGVDVSQEIRIHLRLLGLQLNDLNSQRKALGDPLDVARQHVMREEPHVGGPMGCAFR